MTLIENYPQFAVVPSIAPWRGDLRRDVTPYVLTGGLSYAALSTANHAMYSLNKRGVTCHVEVLS